MNQHYLYVASHSDHPGEGISCYRFDPSSGGLTFAGKSSEVNKVLYLAVHPHHPILYAAADTVTAEGVPDGLISAFRIDSDTGNLSLLNQQHTGGRTPCYISVDQTGQLLAVAHFRGEADVGSLCTLPVLSDGRLGPVGQFLQHEGESVHPQRQLCSHVHAAVFDTDNRHLLVTDLGRDKLMSYRIDFPAQGVSRSPVAQATLPPGSGPRHVAFHPDGRSLYLINELNSTLTTFAYHPATGEMTARQTLSTLPQDFTGKNTCADIHVHPSGKFVYGSNRGHDSVAVFSVVEGDGGLSLIWFAATGKEPRGFTLTDDGAFLLTANQKSHSITSFGIDAESGIPSRRNPIGKFATEVDSPVCVIFYEHQIRGGI